MDMQIPLNKLRFGHEDGAGINARVVGRQEGIAELAVNLHAQGQIENLVVKPCGDGFYSVANGNRRLAAFHMLHTAQSEYPINCTVHEVDETKAFKFSLTTAVTAEQLHPVDQYEGFARLEQSGSTHEEIARQYGMTEKQVRQALALGRLSPTIRQAWREGTISAEIAKAFTLALSHEFQDKVFAKLSKAHELHSSYNVRQALGAGESPRDVVLLLDLVGIEAYCARGGGVIEDLFGTAHIINNVPLLKEMARESLAVTCDYLKVQQGWSWAEIDDDLPHGARWWPKSTPKQIVYEGDEEERLKTLKSKFQEFEDADGYDLDEYERVRDEIDVIEQASLARSFTERQKKSFGCIVGVDEGKLVILYGIRRPEASTNAASDRGAKATGAGAAKTKDAPEEPEISKTLLHALSVQLTNATATALIQDEQLALSALIAGFCCYNDSGVRVSVAGLNAQTARELIIVKEMDRALPIVRDLKSDERIAMLAQVAASALDFQTRTLDGDDAKGPRAICDAIDAKAFNAAARGVFDAKGYFAGVNKALCLRAIGEAMGADHVRHLEKKPKSEIVAFAVENVPPTGWLPVQLRARGYDGPPVAGVAPKGAIANAAGATSESKQRGRRSSPTRAAVKASKAKAKPAPLKRAAAAKKAAKKTSAKKKVR